jgi:DNA mismatch endonuclease (patch repair protein)
MSDTFPRKKRSEIMSHIRSRNTRPEMIVRSLLHKEGYRFRLHNEKLIGKPDIVMKKHRTVIFVHGCFWHQHPHCSRATVPKSNREYWLPKLRRNIERFDKVRKQLEEAGWKVIVIWECETRNKEQLALRIKSFMENATSRENTCAKV